MRVVDRFCRDEVDIPVKHLIKQGIFATHGRTEQLEAEVARLTEIVAALIEHAKLGDYEPVKYVGRGC